MWKKILILFTVLLFKLSCGNSSQKKDSKGKEKSIAVNIQSDPKTIDPQLSTESSGIIVDTLLFEGLTRIDMKGDVVGAVAEK